MSTQGLIRIHDAFARARAEKRCALLPFITGGYPSIAATERLLRELPAAGADLIEVGFPFSDPIADGPVIAESMHRALLSGATPEGVFEAVARAKPAAPVIAMVSASIVGRMGAEAFVRRAVEAGFSGFIVPDADPASIGELSRLAAAHGAGFCALVAPTTGAARLRVLAEASTGFVYLLARAGVTGERSEAPEIAARAAEVRSVTRAPIAAGFGISTREHIAAVGQHADGAIVGSAIVRRMTDAAGGAADANTAAVDAALEMVRSLRA
ncbi:MAG: tryptophan synthase subunit alpha [Phycisphaerales bacterium]